MRDGGIEQAGGDESLAHRLVEGSRHLVEGFIHLGEGGDGKPHGIDPNFIDRSDTIGDPSRTGNVLAGPAVIRALYRHGLHSPSGLATPEGSLPEDTIILPPLPE